MKLKKSIREIGNIIDIPKPTVVHRIIENDGKTKKKCNRSKSGRL